MLRIRPEQLEALEAVYAENFVRWLAADLRARLPEAASRYEERQLEDFVRRAMARADGYGIAEEAHLVAYVELELLTGEELETFPRRPLALRILADPSVDGTHKVPLLLDLRAPRPAGEA